MNSGLRRSPEAAGLTGSPGDGAVLRADGVGHTEREGDSVAESLRPGETIGTSSSSVTQVAGGFLATLGSALVSCGLLLVNGALMMAVCAAASGSVWMQKESVTQVLLFGGPVFLLVVQWIMIDYVRSFLRA